VLHGHCESVGRPYESILRTALVALVLAESTAAVEAKRAQLPPFLGFFEQRPIIGTTEQAVQRVIALVQAGFQYVIFIVFDPQSLQLAAEQVIPAVRSA